MLPDRPDPTGVIPSRDCEGAVPKGLLAVLIACTLLPTILHAQQQEGGIADIAVQGYYLGGNAQPLTALSGLNVSFRELVPQLGQITGNLEGYDQLTRGRVGQNFVTLNGLRWKGRRWTITGGDFRFRTAMLATPFTNYAYPDIGVRGAKVEMADGQRHYTLFWGEETLQEGPQISFRVGIPQNALGAAVRQDLGTKLRVGVRYLGLSSGAQEVSSNPLFFPAGSEYRRSDSISVQSSYQAAHALSLYSDVSLARVSYAATAVYPRAVPLSWLAGARWQSKRLTVITNYGSLSRSALPVAGYYFGDRKGPFAEIRYKAFGSLELFASAVRSTNNLENDPFLPNLSAYDVTAGASATLPGKVSVSGQYSKLGLVGQQATDPTQDQKQNDTQALASLSRVVARHNLTLLVRDLSLNTSAFSLSALRQHQRSAELQDIVQFGRFGFGGAVRMQQQSGAGQLENSVFVRGNAQMRLRRFSVYGQFEIGNDLVSQSLFAMNSVRTTLAGASVALPRGWTMHAEAFRSTLLTTLNPANVLVLQTQEEGVADVLNDFNQWSFLLRLSHRASWGAPLPEGPDNARNDVVYGAIEGFVYDDATGSRGAAGISVELDKSRTAVTDAAGLYRFDEVPEGSHSIGLNLAELPADLSPGPAPHSPVMVRPRGVARADLRVVRAGSSVRGVVRGLAKEDEGVVRLENIVIDLDPSGAYTTCDGSGEFGFYNMTSGLYQASLDKATLPADYVVVSAPEITVDLTHPGAPPALVFRIEKRVRQLPVRKVFTGDSTEPQR
jgi:hypothetical protein